MNGTKAQLGFSVAAQFVRYGAPILFYPIFIRYASAADFAIFVLCMAAGQTVGQFTEFGFGLSAVRELAAREGNPEEASLACGQVICGKLLMFLLTAPVYILIASFGQGQIDLFQTILLPLFIGLSYGFTPNWYYIGTKKAHALATAEVLISLAQLAAVLIFIRPGSGFFLITMTMAVPVFCFSVFGQIAAIRSISFKRPSRSELWAATRTAYHFFIATSSPALMNKLFILVLGSWSSATQIAYYAAGERLASAGINTLTPIVRVLLPRMTQIYNRSKQEGYFWFRRTFAILSVLYFGGALFGAILAPWWVPLVFEDAFTPAVPTIALLLFAVPFSVTGRIVGILYLVPAKMEKVYQRMTLLACVAGAALAIPAAIYGSMTVVVLRLAVEIAIFAGCIFIFRRLRKSEVSEYSAGN